MYNVNLKVLNELAKLAPKDDILYYLKGVQVNIYPDHSIYTVTNGHYLVMYRADIKQYDADDVTMIIPADVLLKTKPWSKACDNCSLKPDGEQWIIQDTVFKPVDATYPDIIRVLPSPENLSADNPAQALDIDYLYTLNKCYQKISGKKNGNLRIMYNKNEKSGAFLDGGDQLIAVLMPLVKDAGTTPEWYDHMAKPVKQVKAA